MERIGEVNKIVSFFHRNVPQRKNFINKSVPHQRLEGLAINTESFFKVCHKMEEKATGVLVPMAMPCVCMNNLSLNLKGFSSSMSRKSSRKSFVSGNW